MGGIGSGGWNKKYLGTIDETLRIDVFWMHQRGILKPRTPRTVTWSSNGLALLKLSFIRSGNTLGVNDATADGSPYPDALAQSITLKEQPRNMGGVVTLFTCPSCGAARQHLYLPQNRFICRDCAGLTYQVRREREVDRAYRRWDKASVKMGGVSWEGWCGLKRPKGMHMRTYDALCERLWAEERIVNRSMGLLC